MSLWSKPDLRTNSEIHVIIVFFLSFQLQMLISIVEKAIAKKGLKESDPFDWEKTPGDVSQATTTTSTPPVGQIYTTPPDNKPDLPNLHASDRVSPSVDMLEDHSEHGNEANRKDGGIKDGNAINKFGTSDRGVIQKIREVLDAVEKDGGNFLKPQAVYLQKATKQVRENYELSHFRVGLSRNLCSY